MPYELTWYAKDVLYLDISDTLSFNDMKSINHSITERLNQSTRPLTLLVDASNLQAGYTTVDCLRNTQLYRDHKNLDAIIVMASSRLNRLITLLVFSLSRAQFVQFENNEDMRKYMMQRGCVQGT